MKGVEPIIAVVLIIAISIAGVVFVFNYTRPSVSKMSDINVFNQAKSVLKQIDSNLVNVLEEGEGSTRVLHLSIGGGNYLIDGVSDSLNFSMESSSDLVGEGVSSTDGNLDIRGEKNKVFIIRVYTTVNITSDGSFSAGNHNIVIRNDGYDDLNGEQMISVGIA
jgi:FlaG/FlaF family flagellin (archaellin)